MAPGSIPAIIPAHQRSPPVARRLSCVRGLRSAAVPSTGCHGCASWKPAAGLSFLALVRLWLVRQDRRSVSCVPLCCCNELFLFCQKVIINLTILKQAVTTTFINLINTGKQDYEPHYRHQPSPPQSTSQHHLRPPVRRRV